MATYNPTTNFTAKDALAAGDPNKIIRGADFGVEFDAISTAINAVPDSPFVNVKDYGALGDGVADDTAAIQSAINYASSNGIQTVLIPDGHYRYTTLRMYHEATDNPNFQETPNRDGKIRLLGHGRFSNNDLKSYDPVTRGVYGTFLEGIAGGEGIIVDPTDAFDAQDSRNFVMEHMTVTANNTGYVIVNRQCPEFTLVNVAIKQVNYQGNGILNRNAWFTNIENCSIYGPSAETNTPEEPDNNTGDGLVGETDFFAGEFNIHNSLIDSWANGFKWNGGQFVNVSLRDTAVQNCNNYNIYGLAGTIFNLLLDNVYFENQSTQGVSFIKSVDDCFRVVKMTNCFMLAGNSGVARVSSHCIDLDSLDALHIDNMYVFRPRQTFLNVTAMRNLQNVSGEIKNSMFLTDENLSAEPTIFLLDGILPNVHNCVWPTMSQGVHNTTGDIRLYDESVYGKYLRSFTDVTGTTAHSKFSYGDTEQVTVATSPYRMSGAGIEQKAYYDLTHAISAGLAVYLPGPTAVKTDGRVIIVRNNENSTSASNYPFINVFVSTGAPPSTGFLVQLAPTEAAMFVFDGKGTNGGDFKCVGKWSDSGADYTVNADTGSETFQSGYESLRFTGGTAISTAVASPSFGEDEVTISLDTTSEVSFGAGIDVTGTVTADSATINGAMSVTGSLTTNQDITISETIPRLVLDDTSATDNSGIIRQANSNLVLQAQGGTSTYGGVQFKRSDGTSDTSVLDIQPDGDVVIYADDGTSQNLFWDASTSRLGLGAGATSPSSTLDVGGELIVTGGGSGTILVNDEDSSLCPTMTFTRNGGGTTTNDFIKFENSGGEVAAIDSAGGAYFLNNVGIGTDSAGTPLDVVSSNADAIGLRLRGRSSDNLTIIQKTDNGATTQQGVIAIDSSGNVGIGTAAPNAGLDIATAVSGVNLKLTNTAAEAAGATQYNANMKTAYADEAFTLYAGDVYRDLAWLGFDKFGKEITFGTGTPDGSVNQRMVIDSSGNVGIGVATPTADLDVHGVFSVDATGEDAFITGDTPALEFVESDNGGARMRMAFSNATMFQSLYGDTTTTFGGFTLQTRASDGTSNQAVYVYDAGVNDRHWWGTRAAGDVAMQLTSTGTFNVRGGDVVFEDSSLVDKFVWDASASALGVGIAAPARTLHISDVMRLEPSATPASPSAGDVYYDSTTNKLRCYNGTTWNNLF